MVWVLKRCWPCLLLPKYWQTSFTLSQVLKSFMWKVPVLLENSTSWNFPSKKPTSIFWFNLGVCQRKLLPQNHWKWWQNTKKMWIFPPTNINYQQLRLRKLDWKKHMGRSQPLLHPENIWPCWTDKHLFLKMMFLFHLLIFHDSSRKNKSL